MTAIVIVCDRCGEQVRGIVIDNVGAAGFYPVGEGSIWNVYARPGEENICDKCMWTDPRYQKDYQFMRKINGQCDDTSASGTETGASPMDSGSTG